MDLLCTEEYMSRVVNQYSRMLLHIASTRLPSPADAEDAVQEAFLRLLTKAPRLRDQEHEKAWLIRTTINLACDFRKKAENRNVPLDETLVAPEEEHEKLLSAVQALPNHYSIVIHLYYYEGYSIQEIAKLLGLPKPTVRTRLSRARKQLKRILEEELE